MGQYFTGLLFALLWSSAAVATKFGVAVADPLILANTRVLLAGSGILGFAYFLQKNTRLPRGKEWKHIVVFSALNTTIFLAAFVLSMRHISAGVGSLSVATNPLLILVMSAIWLGRKLRWAEIAGLIIGLAGVVLASYPVMMASYANTTGLLFLIVGMLSVSAATVYYAGIQWQLSNLVVNGWQVFIGGLLMLPITIIFSRFDDTNFNWQFWAAVGWLVVPVSVVALQLWFYLVKIDAFKASLWLYLCPVFGFFYASILLNEPLTVYTYTGTGLVFIGLYLARKNK